MSNSIDNIDYENLDIYQNTTLNHVNTQISILYLEYILRAYK
jgi:hypothetical protein